MDARIVRGSLAMAGRVKRYACWPTITTQTIAEHVWHIRRVYRGIWGGPIPLTMSEYIDNHDSGELIVGDLPFPIKRDNPVLKAEVDRIEEEALAFLGVRLEFLNQNERMRFKICDLVEMMEYGMYERELGNLLAVPIVTRVEASLHTLLTSGGASDEEWQAVRDYCAKLWDRHEAVLRGGDVAQGYDTAHTHRYYWRQRA